ncbi:hypothetical protein [Natrinema sp. DC36]|nr:hypothetical protein [Natrinema sp. DC36]
MSDDVNTYETTDGDTRPCMLCGKSVSRSKLPQHIAVQHSDDSDGETA